MSITSTLRQDDAAFASALDAKYQAWLASPEGQAASDADKQHAWEVSQGTNPDTSGAQWADPIGRVLVGAVNPLGLAFGSALGSATKKDPTPRTQAPGVIGGVGSMPGTGTTPNPAAWNPTPSAGYGAGYVSPMQQQQQAGIDNRIAILQEDVKTNPALQPALDLALRQKQDLASEIANNPQADVGTLAQKGVAVAGRAAPTLTPTKLDFSDAAPLEQRQLSAGDLQRQQAEALRAGTSGAGQGALIDRLNSDLDGGQPSLAQQQLEEGRDAAMANSLSIANSARGPTAGLTQLEALRANQATMQSTARSAAILRAQEYAQARDALGGVLNQQRTGGIQEQNIASTELGQSRGQDLTALADKYNNAVQQGQLTDADARAQLDAELRQRGMNDSQVQFYTQQYFGQQNRTQDTAIDAEKTRVNAALGVGSQDTARRGQDIQQGQFDANRTDKWVAAGTQALATGGQTLTQAFKGGSGAGATGVQSSPGTATTPQDTGYGYGTDSDPDKLLDTEAA